MTHRCLGFKGPNFTDLEAALQQQVRHAVGVLVQLAESPPLAGALKDQRRLVTMATHRLGEDLRHSVPLTQVTLDVHLHPQQHIGRTEGHTRTQLLQTSFYFTHTFYLLVCFFFNSSHLQPLGPGGESAWTLV